MVPFGGWDMPVQYTGVIDEHKAVRSAAGLFDVSHMGEFESRARARSSLQRVTTNDVAKLRRRPGPVRRAAQCRRGRFVDDSSSTARRRPLHLVVNAATSTRTSAGMQDEHADGVHARQPQRRLRADRRCRARRRAVILQPLTAVDLSDAEVLPLHATARWPACRARLAHRLHRRGRLRALLPPSDAETLWTRCSRPAARRRKPGGLGARDTLRLEAAMRLYGNDIDETTTRSRPASAGSSSSTRATSSARDALESRRPSGAAAQAGRLRDDRTAASPATATRSSKDGERVGVVTSGTTGRS